LRLSLLELDRAIGLPCRAFSSPVVRTLAQGDEIGVAGTVIVALVAGGGLQRSSPVAFGNALLNSAFVHTLVAVRGPLTLRFAAPGPFPMRLCIPSH
jgi:hypothetical protein